MKKSVDPRSAGDEEVERTTAPGEPPRRQRILQAAERLFLHYGPAKTTIADIARASGIGVGTVYLEFGSKEQLVEQLASEKSRIVADRMRAAATKAGPSAQNRLRAALVARIVALLDFKNEGLHGCDLARCMSSKTDFELGEEPRAVLREIVRDGAAAGQLDASDPEEVIGTIELAFGCLSPPFLYRFERQVAEEKAARLAMVVVGGLNSRAGRPTRG
ncbi:MAG: TetR/AcrR family transcriptional regulator [Polyangiaceae bacterium]|nr:TetR/AcrR family transcriptional regulator [Polyangiaceae bacterium]